MESKEASHPSQSFNLRIPYISHIVCVFIEMALTGKVSTEHVILAPVSKWFNLFAKQLHHIQNIAEKVHHTKLHEGDDWHSNESVKHWTYVVHGKVHTCKEKIETVDESNKTITYSLFDEDIGKDYKVFKLIFQVAGKDDGSGRVIWTIEYEKVNENVEPPYGFLDYVTKVTKDIDAHLLKA
ncbi:hypothetical protein RIF29_27059 [Crotalaria pallida]|uniref:Bet v I/Major latex protein domain-containing protein n=1 Tax=Crotalaria pallida TaxID=3830 RepID=A0AAN9ENE0_CROPI